MEEKRTIDKRTIQIGSYFRVLTIFLNANVAWSANKSHIDAQKYQP